MTNTGGGTQKLASRGPSRYAESKVSRTFYAWDTSLGRKSEASGMCQSWERCDPCRQGGQGRMDFGRDPREILGASRQFPKELMLGPNVHVNHS